MLQEAELSGQADSENNLGGSSETMYYIGSWMYTRKRNPISYCVKDAAGFVVTEKGKIGSTRRDLDTWVQDAASSRMMIAMEA